MPVKSRIRTIPDYPKKGIMFRDITTLIKDPVGFRLVIDNITQRYISNDVPFDTIAFIEGILMYLNCVGAILQVILLFFHPTGEFAGFSDGYKPFAECVGQGTAYDKTAGLNTDDCVKGNII